MIGFPEDFPDNLKLSQRRISKRRKDSYNCNSAYTTIMTLGGDEQNGDYRSTGIPSPKRIPKATCEELIMGTVAKSLVPVPDDRKTKLEIITIDDQRKFNEFIIDLQLNLSKRRRSASISTVNSLGSPFEINRITRSSVAELAMDLREPPINNESAINPSRTLAATVGNVVSPSCAILDVSANFYGVRDRSEGHSDKPQPANATTVGASQTIVTTRGRRKNPHVASVTPVPPQSPSPEGIQLQCETKESLLARWNAALRMFDLGYHRHRFDPSVGREKEAAVISDRIMLAVGHEEGGAVHVCGDVGMGKTVTVKHCMNKILDAVDPFITEGLRKYVTIWVNGAAESEAGFYRRACIRLGWLADEVCDYLPEKDAFVIFAERCEGKVRTGRHTEAKRAKLKDPESVFDDAPMVLMAVDEVDQLPRRVAIALVTLAQSEGSRLFLITMSNTVAIHTKLRVPRGHFEQILAFAEYSQATLQRIVESRVPGLFHPSALKLCALKAEKYSGDVRLLFLACQLCIHSAIKKLGDEAEGGRRSHNRTLRPSDDIAARSLRSPSSAHRSPPRTPTDPTTVDSPTASTFSFQIGLGIMASTWRSLKPNSQEVCWTRLEAVSLDARTLLVAMLVCVGAVAEDKWWTAHEIYLAYCSYAALKGLHAKEPFQIDGYTTELVCAAVLQVEDGAVRRARSEEPQVSRCRYQLMISLKDAVGFEGLGGIHLRELQRTLNDVEKAVGR